MHWCWQRGREKFKPNQTKRPRLVSGQNGKILNNGSRTSLLKTIPLAGIMIPAARFSDSRKKGHLIPLPPGITNTLHELDTLAFHGSVVYLLLQPYELGTMITPGSQGRKLRYRELKQFDQGKWVQPVSGRAGIETQVVCLYSFNHYVLWAQFLMYLST